MRQWYILQNLHDKTSRFLMAPTNVSSNGSPGLRLATLTAESPRQMDKICHMNVIKNDRPLRNRPKPQCQVAGPEPTSLAILDCQP